MPSTTVSRRPPGKLLQLLHTRLQEPVSASEGLQQDHVMREGEADGVG